MKSFANWDLEGLLLHFMSFVDVVFLKYVNTTINQYTYPIKSFIYLADSGPANSMISSNTHKDHCRSAHGLSGP